VKLVTTKEIIAVYTALLAVVILIAAIGAYLNPMIGT
jgi:hypothetical protein